LSVKIIKHEITKLLKDLSKNDTQHCFEQWKKHWTKCILSEREYFEGDSVPVQE